MTTPDAGATFEFVPVLPDVSVDEAEARLVSNGIVQLTQAAHRSGEAGIIGTLSTLLNSWAVLIDRYGKPVEAVGAARVHIDDAIATAMKLTRKIRVNDLRSFPIGEAEDPRGYLVVSSRSGKTSRTRDFATQAAALLDLTFFPRRDGRLEMLARHDLVDVLLTGPADLAPRLAARWRVTSSALSVVVLRSRSRSVMLETKVLEWFEELSLPPIVGIAPTEVIAVTVPEAIEALTGRITRAADIEHIPVRAGIGRAEGFSAVGASYQQARQAADIAIADGRPIVLFESIPIVGLLLNSLSATTVFALTDPLRALATAPEGIDGPLVESLRVFLAENGSWEAAASQLGVHRHTLRHRIERIEALTGLNMSSAEDRFQAWLAIRALSERAR